MSGAKNLARSLQSSARRHARAAARALRSIRANKAAMASSFVREHVIRCQYDVDHLVIMLKEACRHCGKKVPFGCTQCAGCADERGP